MKTKWDVLLGLFEQKEARLSQIADKVGSSPSSVSQQLKELMRAELVEQDGNIYKPNKEAPKTWNVFKIMKFCKNKGISPNLFLSEEVSKILSVGLSKETVQLSDFKNLNYKTVRKYLTYLNRINLVFVIAKRPLTVKFVQDPVFDEVLDFFDVKKPQLTKKSPKPMPKSDYTEIDGLLKKLSALKRDLNLSEMEEEFRIEFTSASTQLEGNTFTLDESKELILHDVIPADKKLREANEVKNYYNAVNYFLSHLEEPMSLDLILDLHRIIVYNLGVKDGVRSSRVSIKGNPFYKVANFQEIFPRLDELCKKINDFVSRKHSTKETIEFATFVHNEFQHIHPFEDGNSRMTRLLWNYILMKGRFPLINIYSNTREEYLSLTKLSRHRDDAKLNAFLMKVIKDNLYKRLRV